MTNLSDKINRLKEQAQDHIKESERKLDHSKLGMTAKEVMGFQKFLSQVIRAAIWLWWNVGNPIMNIFTMPLFKWALRKYRKFWDKFAYYTDKYNTRQFSLKRAAAVLAFTVFCFAIAGETLAVARDTGLYFLTANKNETVYLFSSQDNSFTVEGDDFSVSGCEITNKDSDVGHCNDDDSLYFRVESTLFNNIWSLIERHSLYLPDRVQAPIAPGWNKCVITSYGIRARFAIKSFNMYQELLSTNCESLK